MASLEGDNVIVINKFNGENFNLYIVTLELGLVSMDLWTSWTNPRRIYLPKVKK